MGLECSRFPFLSSTVQHDHRQAVGHHEVVECCFFRAPGTLKSCLFTCNPGPQGHVVDMRGDTPRLVKCQKRLERLIGLFCGNGHPKLGECPWFRIGKWIEKRRHGSSQIQCLCASTQSVEQGVQVSQFPED